MSTSEVRTGGASGLAEQQAAELLGVREGYAEVGDQRLHYVEAGEGPLLVLLQGFREFWYGWRLLPARAGRSVGGCASCRRP